DVEVLAGLELGDLRGCEEGETQLAGGQSGERLLGDRLQLALDAKEHGRAGDDVHVGGVARAGQAENVGDVGHGGSLPEGLSGSPLKNQFQVSSFEFGPSRRVSARTPSFA